ncbi:HTH domain-containing protein [Haloarcula pelagica]|uniref:HTH domain-containing protein n=1 Tax=Haloarcula pelagica TaxID=3033389 RepID=UPI0024C2D7C8|nr:HTH domain-containing protein [Halomicroarcula sp. YJ-61-S]
MPETECPGTRRVELFVRGSLPTPSRKRQAAVEADLEELARRGAVDETTTTTWAKRVPIEDCGARTERARYNEFAAWARQAGATLAPFFDTRLCYSMQTGEKREELVMPAMCVAVYEDGDLTRVAPATGDDGPTSIEDCLTDLAAHAETAQRGTTTASTAD